MTIICLLFLWFLLLKNVLNFAFVEKNFLSQVGVGVSIVGTVSRVSIGVRGSISSISIVSIEKSSISLRLSISRPLTKVPSTIGVRVSTIGVRVGRVSIGVRRSGISIVGVQESSISLRLSISRPLANVPGTIGVRVSTIGVGVG